MANLLAAVEAIKREAKRYEQLIEAAAYLETLGSLEQAEIEAKRRVASAQQAAGVAQARLDELTARIDEANAEAEAIVAQAHERSRETARTAEAEKLKITEEARNAAVKIVADARTAAHEIAMQANSRRDEAEARVQALEREEQELRLAVANAQTELAGLSDRIEKARREIKRLLGNG